MRKGFLHTEYSPLAGRVMCQVSAPDAAVASAASPSFLLRVVQFLVGLVEQDERDDGDGTGHVQVGLRLHAERVRRGPGFENRN